MRKYLLSLFISIFSVCLVFAPVAFAQTKITGKLLDAQTKEPLIGATVTVKGTTDAAAAGLDGSFKITAPSGSTLVISYIGYVSKEVTVSGKDLGDILVDPVSASLSEVVITGSALAIDRQTPIAASSVGAVYIEEKGGGAEFPELLKSTPGVTVSRSGGGYGDSRIAIRGFNSNNIALLINGIPVNDVEAGKIFWNDWAGLSDVTTSMQVQRGLGAAKIAVPSMGGTIDINTRSLEKEQGGTISQSIGSYNALKTTISYATGLSEKGWASSFLLSKSTGDGNAEGLYYTGYSYFFNLSKVINKSQTISLNFMGASQIHGQRYTYQNINTYRMAPQGIRYNSDYGYLNGQILSAEQNLYNKPLASLNHNWKIDETSSLSTVVYWSSGVGAARYITGTSGTNVGLAYGSKTEIPRTGNAFSPIDFNTIVKNNQANADGSSSTYFNDAANNHRQTGLLSSYKKQLGDINLLAGIDLRTYNGDKFYRLNDLLGGSYLVDNTDVNNPNRHVVTGDYINNHYRYLINTYGAYLQTEYVKNNLSAFITVAGNNTADQRIDYFNYLNTDPNQKSKIVNFLGYQAKGGANYNIDNQNNVFANVGYIQRAPYVASVFLNKKNDLNTKAIPEKLFDYELGYGFTSSQFSTNVNLYRSTYKDRAKSFSAPANQDGSITTYNVTGINELHQGVEIDAKYRPISDVTVSGMVSIGDYHYLSNTGSAQVTSDQPGTKAVSVPAFIIKGLPIGDLSSSASSNAQTTAALGLDVKVLPNVKVGANANYFAKYYASFDPSQMVKSSSFDPAVFKAYKMPSYSTLDLNVVYKFKFAGLDASFIGNVYNLLNTAYLTEGYESTPTNGTDASRLAALGVNYGNGRVYMTTLKVKF